MPYQFEESGKLKSLTSEELVEADKEPPIIVLNTGTLDDGTHYWAYMALKPSRYKEFMKASEKGKILRLGEYGDIIRCGLDEKVPHAVKAKMKRLYGCDDDCMAKLTEDIQKAQKEFMKKQQDKRIDDALVLLKNKP